MSVRLSELAKELGTTKKELLEKLPALGFELKKSIVDIDDDISGQIKDALKRSGATFDAPKPKKRPSRPSRPAASAKSAGTSRATQLPKPAPTDATNDAPAAAETLLTAIPSESPASREEPMAATPEVKVTPAPEPLAAETPPAEAPLPVAAHPAAAEPAEKPRPIAPTGTPPVDPDHVMRRPPAPILTPIRPRLPRQSAASGTLVPRQRMPGPARPDPGAPRDLAATETGGRPEALQAKRPPRPAGPGGRPLPEQPRTTPKAPRPTSPRPYRGWGRRGGTGGGSGGQRPHMSKPAPFEVPKGPLKPVTLSEGLTVKELSEKLGLKSRDVIKRLMERGIFATINQSLDREVAINLSREFSFDAKIVTFEEDATLAEVESEVDDDLVNRPPVVTVMGHVDHGKTTLLDAIRETNVAAHEAGQITQHIGAYQVETRNRTVTFLDTPGHEAFTMMRARGARVTDIVILVVSADDGVMPQTLEAIHHAKAANVPIIVAINKIDLPGANPDRVMQMLSDNGLVSDEWGGDTTMVKISAKKRIGLTDLLDLVLLVADMLTLKANPNRSANGVVLEAKLDKGRGPVATVLIQTGTVRDGDPFIAGAVSGKVRAMFDDHKRKLDAAGPSTPVEILGLQGVPGAGDSFQVVSEDWKARQIGSFRQAQLREKNLSKSSRLTLDQLYKQISEGQARELPIVLKGDVQGSVEALTEMLQKLSNDRTKVRILHSGTGAVTETDVLLSSASNAIIIGFNVRPERKARELAEHEKVDIRLHTIIYKVTEEIEAAMQGLLEPTFRELVLGRAEVRQVFRIPKVGVVSGCMVQEGKITRDSQVRLLRDNVIIHEGRVLNLRRFKEDASEVRSGYECGISLANYQDLKENDIIEAFKLEKVAPTAAG